MSPFSCRYLLGVVRGRCSGRLKRSSPFFFEVK
jgi:hypothetical protein